MADQTPSTGRRHRGYALLLFTCIGVITCLMLPAGLRQLSAIGYVALPLVLMRSLGCPPGSIAGRA